MWISLSGEWKERACKWNGGDEKNETERGGEGGSWGLRALMEIKSKSRYSNVMLCNHFVDKSPNYTFKVETYFKDE